MGRRARREDQGDGRAAAEPGDDELIARVRAGDVAAYGTLYERHAAAARGLARHLTGRDGADDAEDAVQDAFAKVLDALERGGGPAGSFRPYLLTAVRRAVYDRARAERRVQSTGEIEDFDSGAPFADPAVDELERSMVAAAFRSLPARWQTVLWHTEVERAKPAAVAPLLGLSPNAAAALAYRAREGLRQAYLQMHVDAAAADGACRPALEQLGSYVRGALAKRDARRVRRHLDGCPRCAAVRAELAHVNGALRGVVGPLVLGTATSGYLASKGGVFLLFRRLPKRRQAMSGGVVAAAAAAAMAMMLVSGEEPTGPAPAPPAAAEPAAAPPAEPPTEPPAAAPPSPPHATRRARPMAEAPKRVQPRKPRVRKPVLRKPPVRKPPERPDRPKRPEHPGAILIRLDLRTVPGGPEIHIRIKADLPCPFPRAVPHRRAHAAPPHAARRPSLHSGRHGRLKAGSRAHRG
ncbi:sigma-70 family RNA polymerase sigma factor [Actinomadura decatromicini]|uniref:Sigma-70 family RNA polymerase sigma factor n=1 Tax=Actinomadura decatromicini TaxID=2604572 RepID=A0A5D3FNM5_9ACTN|nr:sigma-70 family RNA polymerase sigma factor [Actinomadura decatromicini]TYK50397.1 sigma-70 family RNA polymerase sigma factor [Actinomadura decatromicini]